MRARALLGALLLAAPFVFPMQALAQEGEPADSVEVVEIRLVDGSRLIGTVESESDTEIVLRTPGGATVRIPVAQVAQRRVVTGRMHAGRYQAEDPNVTRLFFTATGRPLRQGQGYFADYWLFFPFVAYGIADRLTMGGGVSLIPGAGEQLVYFAPKLTLVHEERASISAGVLAGTVTGEETWGGLLYGVGTFGTTDQAVTLGIGFAWGGGDIEDTPILLVGAETRVSGSIKLISENYIIPGIEDAVLLSGGVRFFGERVAADLGFVTTPAAFDDDGFPFLPWVGFAYNFGH